MTINTNHINIVCAKDTKKDTNFNFKEIIEEAQLKEGIDLYDNTNFKLSVKKDYYIGKLSLKYKKNCVPLLITAGTISNKNHIYLWTEILRMKDMLFPFDENNVIPPKPPYIIDMISPSLYNQLDVFRWTEEFTVSLGWILLSV